MSSERVKKVVAKKVAAVKVDVKKTHRLPVIYQIRHNKITIERKPSGREPKPYVPETRLDRWVWDTLKSYVEVKPAAAYTPIVYTSSTAYTPNATYTPSLDVYTPSYTYSETVYTPSYTPSASSYTPAYTQTTQTYTKVNI